MKKTLFIILCFALVLSFGLYAGGQQEEVVEEATEEESGEFEGLVDVDHESWEIGKAGGTFIRSTFGSDPKTFNEAVAAETSTTDVTSQLYAAAVRRNQLTLEYEPALAERYEISDDQKTVTFYLKEGTKFSDGEEVTAEDFIFTANQVLLREDVGSNYRSGLFQNDVPSEWKLIDEYTFSVTVDTVYAGLLNLAGIPPLPMHIFAPLIGWDESKGWDYEWEMVTEEDDEGNDVEVMKEIKPDGVDYSEITSFWGVDTDVTKVVGNGPFKLKEYVPSQKVVLEKNPNYYEKDEDGNQLPYLDEVVYVIVEDQDTQLAKFLAGELDYYGLRGEDYATLVDEKEEGGFELYNVGPAASTQFVVFNQTPEGLPEYKRAWTENKDFRLAMAHLVDRQAIIDNIAYGFGYPQYSFVPKISPYYWEGADDAAAKYDPEKAKEILDSIGYKDTNGDGIREDGEGNDLVLDMTTNAGNSVREQIGEMFAQECNKVGVKVEFQPEDFNVMVGKLLSGQDWEIILIGLTGSVDPISGANVYPSSGNLHMVHPNQSSPLRDWEKRVDEAWKVANNTTDEEQRKEGFQTIQEIWIEYNPWIYTYNAATMHAYGEEYGNIKPYPIDGYSWDGILSRMYVK